jgi:cytochrome c-type biogenesis protein CcmF
MVAYAVTILITLTQKTETDFHLRPGQHFVAAPYRVLFRGMENVPGPNYMAHRAVLDLYRKDGSPVIRLIPEKRDYGEGQMPMSEASIFVSVKEDFYVSLGEVDADGQGVVVRVYRNPLIAWFAVGAALVIFGAFISLLHKDTPAERLEVQA